MNQQKIKPKVFTKKHYSHPENAEINHKFKQEMERQRREKLKKIKIVLLTTAFLSTNVGIATIFLTNKDNHENSPMHNTGIVETSDQQNITNENIIPVLFDDGVNMTLKMFGDTAYYTCSPEYVMNLAQNSLTYVETTLQSINGITPVATDNGDFYPEYFNEYLLTAMALCESSFRVADSTGKPLVSKENALGMMQIRPQTLEDVNNWLKNTMKLDIQYTLDDLANPQKSMDIATFILVQTCKNHGKEHCNNPIYPYLNENFSISRQQEIVLAVYNNGYGNMIKYINEGTVFDYLSEGSKDNYVNKIMRTSKQLEDQYPQLD